MTVELPGVATERSTAELLDGQDPLASFRSEFFHADPDQCYLDGNSLGKLPLATKESVASFVNDEWGTELVEGWAHWIDEAQVAGDVLAAATLGVGPGQTLVCDTTSVNFYQLAIAAIRSRPGRKTVIIDSANFPTDRYILEGIAYDLGLTLITLDTDGHGGPGAVSVTVEHERVTAEVLAPYLTEDVALVTLQAINYRSGARSELAEIQAAVTDIGAHMLWDCSHAGGAIDLDFEGNKINLAVGCTYKYGNSGPGSPAWLFVRHELQQELQVPIRGWFAQGDQFAMGPWFEKAKGIRGFQIASPSIIGIRGVQASYEMIRRAGIAEIEKKAALGTQLMIELVDAWLAPHGFTLGTPREAAHRGGHIIVRHPEAATIALALRQMVNVVPDYRQPDAIRLAISPLPTSYTEVWDGFDRLRGLMESGAYREVGASESRVT
ncbi:MAG: aminotransferase class V-fold PLP-dependent enzyme [Pontimonas sp.]